MPFFLAFLIFISFSSSVLSEVTIGFNTPSSKRPHGTGIPCQQMVLDTIDMLISKKPRKCKIQIAMYSLDNLRILNKLNEAIGEGVEVDLLLDQEQNTQTIDRLSEAKIKSYRDPLLSSRRQARTAREDLLTNANSAAIIGKSFQKGQPYNQTRVLHEKFSVYTCEGAAGSGDGNPDTIILGSYNWTEAASEVNYENCIKIQDDPDSIDAFKARFQGILTMETVAAPPATPAAAKSAVAVTPKTTSNTSSSTPGGSYSEQHKKKQEYEAKKKPTPALDRLASPSPLKTKSGKSVGIPRAKKTLKEGDDG